jgi:general secretion pathway protein G
MARSEGASAVPDGFTLIELLLVVAIMGVLAAIVAPRFQEMIERARVARAIGDIRTIEVELAALDSLPSTLDAVGRASYLDPWGRPYAYLKLEGKKGVGGARKDRFLVPLNSDYDLYSVGRDGASSPALTAKPSRDDVLRANDGSFIGLASRY